MNCKKCNNTFESKAWNAIFCSNLCKSSFHTRAYYHRHRVKCLEKKKEYYQDNRDSLINKSSTYCNIRRRVDIDYKIKRYLRSRLYNAIKNNYKSGSAVRDLGCSIEELKIHLESKFTEGMTWENYGQWHIDHIKPLASFNLSNYQELKEACHYNNLQPLWAIDNIRKGG